MKEFGWDEAMDGPSRTAKEIVGDVTPAQATRLLQSALDKMGALRRDLALAYSAVSASDLIMEHEVGESLTAVRKAIKRTREALGKVSQQKLMD